MATETWVLNPEWHGKSYNFTGLSFISNSETFSSIKVVGDFGDDHIYYDDKLIVFCQDDGYVDWKVDVAYSTIAFATAPTGDLLTWLQANGTKKVIPQVTVDLTSLSGYESLPAGTYQLGVKSKAANYQDSDLSSTVSFTKLAAPVATASETTVTWDAITNANSYDVYVDGELYENTTGGPKPSKYKLTFSNNVTCKVNDAAVESGYFMTNGDSISLVAKSGHLEINNEYDLVTAPENIVYTNVNITVGTVTFTSATITSATIQFAEIVSPEFIEQSVTKELSNNVDISYIQSSVGTANVSKITNLDTSKIYTVATKYNNIIKVSGIFAYQNSKWQVIYVSDEYGYGISGAYIRWQSDNTIEFTLNSNMVASDVLSGKVLSGNAAAEASDFEKLTTTWNDVLIYTECLIEGTLITLADGTTKPIEDIIYDDDILVWNFYESKFDSAKPCWIMKPQIATEYNLCKFSNGAEVGFVGQGGSIGYHRIYNDEAKAFTHTGVTETPVGTHTFAEDKSFPELVLQEVIKKPVRFYNIGTTKHINLFANGILTSSRISNKYAIENMKYVGERLISDDEERAYVDKALTRC